MASGESESYLPEPWIKKHSDGDSGRTYYFNARTKECTWSHPDQIWSGDGGNETRSCPSPTESLVKKRKKIADKEPSSESVYVLPSGGSKIDCLESPKKKRLYLTESAIVQRNATVKKGEVTANNRLANYNCLLVTKENATTSDQKSVNSDKEKDDKTEVKENIEAKFKKEHDAENVKTDNEPRAVDLCDVERKPISFSLKSKKPCLKDDTNQLAETSKPKPAVHPSISRIQKLNKLVKWGEPKSNKKKEQAQYSMTSPLTEKVEGDNFGPKEKLKNLEDLRNIIKTPKEKQDKDLVAVFRRPKKRTNKAVVKSVESLVDLSYHSDEEEDSTGSEKPQHVQEQSVAELVCVAAKVVSPISPKQHKRQLKRAMKTKTPTDVRHFVGYNKNQNNHLAKKYRKYVQSEFTNKRFCGKKTRYEDNNKYAKKVSQLDKVTKNNKYAKEASQLDEVTDMEVDVQEIIEEIASFRGNPGHSWNGEILRLSMDYDRDFKSVYYVTDTNVLLHDIGFLDDLKTREMNERSIIIVIPYVVLQELDGLKKSHSIGGASSKAIAWCNRHFERNDKRVVGQIYEDYLQTLSEKPRNSADDLIRDCCLLMKKQALEVVLLTNDTNLRNKALLSKINAVGAKKLQRILGAQSRMVHYNPQPVRKDDCKPAEASSYPEMMSITYHKETVSNPCVVLEPKRRSVCGSQKVQTDLLEKIKTSLHMSLGRVLEASFKDSYGEDLWLKIILHKPPWTLDQVFTCWDKHWLAVFNDKFEPEVRNLVGKIKVCLNYTNTKEDLETLEEKVRVLYKFFENLQYKHCVLPLNPDTLEEQGIDSLVSEPEQVDQKTVFSGGLTNAKKMIDLVGSHITHVLAMICDAFEVPHSLNRLNVGQMSREDAASSAVNLHDVIMKLGIAVVSCLSSATSVSLRELGTLLVGFWNKANELCPNLPFTEEDLCILATSSDGQKYLQLVAGELERLLTMLKSIMNM